MKISTFRHYLLALRVMSGLLLGFSLLAQAYDEQSVINFSVTGTIEEPSCEVQVKPSNSIDLGTVSYQELTNKPGAHSDNVPLSLEFTQCSKSTSSVAIAFDGDLFSHENPMLYKSLLVNSGGAQDVGLQLLSKADQAPLGDGALYTFAFTPGAETQLFNMIARMYTSKGKITAGNVLYTVTFNVTYK